MKSRRPLMGVVFAIAVCAVLTPAGQAGGQLVDPARLPEKRFSFSMQAQPWNQIFKWLSDTTGQPVVAASVPPGTFSFAGPRDRTYTIGELVDVLNDGLGGRFLLMRRPGSWLVVPADQRVDPSLILQVRLDELPSRGKSELVRILMPLEGAEPMEAQAAVKGMLSPFGTALLLGKRLLITDRADNVQAIARVLREAEGGKGGAKAPAMRIAVVALTSLDAVQTVKLLRGLYATGRGSSLALEADVAQNTVVVRGSPEQVEEIHVAIKTLGDTGTPTGGQRIITLESGTAATLAEELSRVLQQMRKNPVEVIVPGKPAPGTKPPAKEAPPPKSEAGKALPPVQLIALGGRLLATSDDPQALLMVQQLVKLYTDPTAGELKVVRLKRASAVSVARVVEQTFNDRAGQAESARVKVVADPGSNTLLVRAAPLDVLMIEKLIAQTLDVDSGAAESVEKSYLIPLRHVQAADAAKVLRDIFPVKTVTIAVEVRTNSLLVRCPEAALQDVKKTVELLDVKPEKKE